MRRLVLIVGCLAAAGCSVLPGAGAKQTPPATATGTPTPVAAPVTAQETATILANYVKRNNAANNVRSDKLLAGYEGGSSLAIDKAGYASSRRLGRGGYRPFGYVKPTHAVPSVKEGRWFLTTAYWNRGSETAKEPTYLLFARDGESWRQMYAPDVLEGQAVDELPEITMDASGTATEVAQSDAAGLMMSPAMFARSYAAHLVGKGATRSRSRFAADRLTTDAASSRVRMNQYAKLTERAPRRPAIPPTPCARPTAERSPSPPSNGPAAMTYARGPDATTSSRRTTDSCPASTTPT